MAVKDMPTLEMHSVKVGEPVKIWRRELVGTGTNAAGCLELIGKRWIVAKLDGVGHDISYEFELDDHVFRVTVSPLPGDGGDPA